MHAQRNSRSSAETRGPWNGLNYADLKEQCQKLYSENAALKACLKELSVEIEADHDVASAPLQARIAEQEEQIAKARMELDQREKLAESLQKQLDDEKHTSTCKYQQQWKESVNEVVEKNKEIKDTNERIVQLTMEKARLGAELEAERRTAKQKQKEIDLERDEWLEYIKKVEEEIVDLKRQNAELSYDNKKLKVEMIAEALTATRSNDERIATPPAQNAVPSSSSSSPESLRRKTDHRIVELQKSLEIAQNQAAAYKEMVSGFKAELSALKQTVQIETTKMKGEALHSLASAVSLLQAYDGQGLYISQASMQVWPTLDSVVKQVAKEDRATEDLQEIVQQTRLQYADLVGKFANLRQLYDDARQRLRDGRCDERIELESKIDDLKVELRGATSDVERWKSQFTREQAETRILKSANKAIENELEEKKQKLLEETLKFETSQKELQRATEKLNDCRDYRQRCESAERELRQMKEEKHRRTNSTDNSDEVKRWKDKFYDLDRKFRRSNEDWRKREETLNEQILAKSSEIRDFEKMNADCVQERFKETEAHQEALRLLDQTRAELESSNQRLSYFTSAFHQRQPWQSPVHPAMIPAPPPPNFSVPPPPIPLQSSAPVSPSKSVLTNPEILRLKRENAELNKQNAELNHKISVLDRDYAKHVRSESAHVETKYQKKYHDLRNEYDEFRRNAERNDPASQYRKNFLQQAQMIKELQADVDQLQADVDQLQIQVKEFSERNEDLERICLELRLQLDDSKQTQDQRIADAHDAGDEAMAEIATLKENISRLEREKDEVEQNNVSLSRQEAALQISSPSGNQTEVNESWKKEYERVYDENRKNKKKAEELEENLKEKQRKIQEQARDLKAAKDEAAKGKEFYKKRYTDVDNDLKETKKREQLLNAGNKSLKADLEKRDIRITELESELNAAKQAKAAVENEYSRLSIELRDEKDTVDDVRKRSSQLQLDVEAKNDRIAALEKEIEQLAAAKKQTTENALKAQRKVGELEKTKADAESRAAELSTSLEQQQKLTKAAESQRRKMESERNGLKTDKENLEKTMAAKAKDISRLETECSKLMVQLVTKDAEIRQLTAEIQRFKGQPSKPGADVVADLTKKLQSAQEALEVEKRVSQQSLLDQGKHLQKRIDNLDAQLKNANLAKQMAVAEAQKQAHDERDRAYSGQQPQSQADEPAAKRQKIETESQETEIKKLKSQIKYLERKAHCLGSEVDAKDEVVATFRDESEAKSRENDRLKGEIETMKLAVAELERELRQLKKSRDVLTESLNASTTMSETALAHSRNLEEIHAETLARISNEFDNLVKDSELLHEVAKRGEEMGDFANDEGN